MTPGDAVFTRARHGRLWLCIGLLILVAGCTSVPALIDTAANVGRWQGRFSLTILPARSADTEAANEERAQGRFNLQRELDGLKLALFSPFGQTLANAVSDENGASLTTAKGRQFRAPDTDSLVEQALGWRLPVQAMPGWLSGNGLAKDDSWVQANGWNVRIEKRLPDGKPARLAARWPIKVSPDERQLKLFIIVDPKRSQ